MEPFAENRGGNRGGRQLLLTTPATQVQLRNEAQQQELDAQRKFLQLIQQQQHHQTNAGAPPSSSAQRQQQILPPQFRPPATMLPDSRPTQQQPATYPAAPQRQYGTQPGYEHGRYAPQPPPTDHGHPQYSGSIDGARRATSATAAAGGPVKEARGAPNNGPASYYLPSSGAYHGQYDVLGANRQQQQQPYHYAQQQQSGATGARDNGGQQVSAGTATAPQAQAQLQQQQGQQQSATRVRTTSNGGEHSLVRDQQQQQRPASFATPTLQLRRAEEMTSPAQVQQQQQQQTFVSNSGNAVRADGQGQASGSSSRPTTGFTVGQQQQLQPLMAFTNANGVSVAGQQFQQQGPGAALQPAGQAAQPPVQGSNRPTSAAADQVSAVCTSHNIAPCCWGSPVFVLSKPTSALLDLVAQMST